MTRVGSISPYASLETSVEEARLSFACVFSSSEEFEAALIKNRRDAGHYGRSHRQRHGIIGIAAGLLIILSIVVLVF
jgi:hypothetical protein